MIQYDEIGNSKGDRGIFMNKDKLIEQISILRNSPDKYIELLEETSGRKLFWYQKIILKRMINKNTK